MFIKSKIILTTLITSASLAHANIIMVEKLDCTAPARNGHIFIATPAPKLKIVSRPSAFGTYTNYLLELTPLYPSPEKESHSLEVVEEQPMDGWVHLETEGATILLKEDNSKATIYFDYGAHSKCKLKGINL